MSSDLQSLLEQSSQHFLQITQQHRNYVEDFLCPDGEKINVDGDCVLHIPLYRDEDSQKMLLLVNPQKKDSVVAVYLNGRWWGVDDILQSCVPIQEGLRQVQTCGERIVLFVLNCLVCGFMESGSSENGVSFLPHSAGELAKIIWHHGEAVAFYTYKNKGSLCDQSSQCYMLPVLDTIYVREKWRKHGFGMTMLRDFCQMFAQEDALGISFPISSDMYHVCGRFLMDKRKEQDRLWEVDPPGDWSQRINIWLRIQLGETPVKMEHPTEEVVEATKKEPVLLRGQTRRLTGKDSIDCLTEPLYHKRKIQTRRKWWKNGAKMRRRKLLINIAETKCMKMC
ncbi:PREDICTED: protein FAM169B-like [Nanorana parkeri]|uniref:protein FAM169B-like n=1 Tax=Nanorana parkeri TaxID=125878 RepID=UPI0008547A2C|nr:PREDICTED: protein FAM169B-like [Nanorana parkeri]